MQQSPRQSKEKGKKQISSGSVERTPNITKFLRTQKNVISFNDQGQLCQLTCAQRRDLPNHTRNHDTLHQKFWLPADIRWGSFVTHSFLPYGPWGRNECVTNEPQRTSAGRLPKIPMKISFHYPPTFLLSNFKILNLSQKLFKRK